MLAGLEKFLNKFLDRAGGARNGRLTNEPPGTLAGILAFYLTSRSFFCSLSRGAVF